MVKTRKSNRTTTLTVGLPRRASPISYEFDTCVHILYANREQTLVKQLCCGDASLSFSILHDNIEHFLGSSDTQLLREAKAIKDKDELCHFLRMHMSHRSFLCRLLMALKRCGTSIRVALLKLLTSSYYLKSILNRMRRLLNQPMYQFLFFVPVKGMVTQRNYFNSLTRMMYGEEFWLVHSVNKLACAHKYFTHYARQLSFMISHKGFEVDDLFTKRNPNYLIASRLEHNVLLALKTKCGDVIYNCNYWMSVCRKHKDYHQQSKAYREYKRQQQVDEREQKRLKLEEQKVYASFEKVDVLRERNMIEREKVKRI